MAPTVTIPTMRSICNKQILTARTKTTGCSDHKLPSQVAAMAGPIRVKGIDHAAMRRKSRKVRITYTSNY